VVVVVVVERLFTAPLWPWRMVRGELEMGGGVSWMGVLFGGGEWG